MPRRPEHALRGITRIFAPWLPPMLAMLALAWPGGALAAPQVEVKMSATPEVVAVGDRIDLEIRVDAAGGRIDRVELPGLQAFTVLGHRRSSPVRFQFGLRSGAQVEATEIHQFTLRAEAPGVIEIAAPVAIVEGERYEGAPVTIRVEGGAGVTRGPSAPPPQPEVGASLDEIFDARAFLRTSVDRDEVFVGEQVIYQIELFTRVGGSPRFTREASTDGFWVQDLSDPNRPAPERREIVKGVPFQVYTIKRVAAFPLRQGTLTIGAPTLEFSSTSAFGLVRGDRIVRHGAQIPIRVKPLPEGTPKGALVGQFTMRSELDRRALRVGEAATLSVVVEGRGHVRDLDLTLRDVPGVRTLAPEIDTSTSVRGGVVHSRREARFLLIAEEPGSHRIPGLSVHAFDPSTGETTRLATPGYILEVAPDDDASAPPEPAEEPPDAALERGDSGPLGPFRGHAMLERGAPAIAGRGTFFALLAIPPLALALACILRALLGKRRAAKGARERERRHQRLLLEARRRRREGDAPGLYAALASATHAALEELIGHGTRGLTHRELEAALTAHGAPGELVTRTIEELEGLDFARFAAESTHEEEMDRAMVRIAAILDRLDGLKTRGRR